MGNKRRYSFDEERDAEETINKGFLQGKIDIRAMYGIAKYFRTKEGLGEIKLERKLIEFCSAQDATFNPLVEANNIKKWVRRAMFYELRKTELITITHYEMDVLKTIHDLKHRKIFFAVLVFAKSLKSGGTKKGRIESKSGKYYIHYSNLDNIAGLLDFKITKIQLADILYQYTLYELLIPYNAEKEIILVNFAKDDSPTAMTIKEPELALQYYRAYFGGDTSYCQNCGKEMVKKVSNNHRFCDECQLEKVKLRDRERKKRNSTS
jgi:hypothetical protein